MYTQQYMLYHIMSSVQQSTAVRKLRESNTCKNSGRVEVLSRVYAMLNIQERPLKTTHDDQYRNDQPVLIVVPFELG